MGVQIVVFMLLSAFHNLRAATIWQFLIVWVAAGACVTVVSRSKLHRFSLKWSAIVPICLLAFVAWRAMLFADPTWDAQTYGVPRIALWMNYRSIFVDMPTEQINIFSSEWNGELNSLLYGIVSRRIDQLAFANVEALAILCLASYWLAVEFGATRGSRTLVAMAICCTPAILGLATTTKGDLLACATVVLAFAWLAVSLRTHSTFSLAMALLSFALAAGSKIGVLPGACICTVWMTWYFKDAVLRLAQSKYAIPIVLGAAVFLARFLANLAIYHHPFQRVPDEHVKMSFFTFLGNLELVAQRWVNWWPVWGDGITRSAALSGGLGVTGAVALIGLGTRLSNQTGSRCLVLLALACVLSTAALLPLEPWNFRYLLPFLLPLFIWMMAAPTRHPRLAVALGWAATLTVASIANLQSLAEPGELNPAPTFASAIEGSLGLTPLQRAMRGYGPYLEVANTGPLGLDQGDRRTIALYNRINTAATPFVGSRAQHRLYLAGTLQGLATLVRERHPDIVVIARRFRSRANDPLEDFPEAEKAAIAPGYRWIVDNDTYVLAVRKDYPGA
jgi:hypothetical protein